MEERSSKEREEVKNVAVFMWRPEGCIAEWNTLNHLGWDSTRERNHLVWE
jgi:hypothetical protein